MKIYIKDGVKKSSNKIIIYKNGYQYINPSEELILSDGWEEYKEPTIPVYEPSEEELFNMRKEQLINDLYEYDSSEYVNICYIQLNDNILPYWTNKNERSVLKSVIHDYIDNNIPNYRLDLRDLNISIELNCELLLNILSVLEIYASQCYNVTTDHLYNINKLTTLEELNNYNFKINYPEKLTFTV
jgi:hypothetical protein